ncbi:MAG TPA: serine hydrolase domain-containing protein [Thermomicrobiales bacterium]|nr:serine hydrolase domain-containing protein [Thermomicrobiales bacterium]
MTCVHRLSAITMLLVLLSGGFGPSTAMAKGITSAELSAQADLVDFGDVPASLLLAVTEADGTVTFATKGEHPDGTTATPEDAYRVGSITKIFTAVLVLSLVEEGKVDLDASAATYIARVPIPENITVRQLLNHTSGLPNYLDAPAYYEEQMADPKRVWTPEDDIALIADLPVAEPGSAFMYANTNYIYLGVLIEEVTGSTYDAVLSERILEPLKLEHTWLDGFQTGTAPVEAWTYLDDGYGAMTLPYTATATATWAAGGLVSTAADLHMFMTALFAGEIVTPESLTEMTALPTGEYGMGLMPFGETAGEWGHIGSMPGYSTFLAHSTVTGRTLFLALTNDAIDVSPVLPGLLERLNQP